MQENKTSPLPPLGTQAWLRAQTEGALDAFVAARSHAARCSSREAWMVVAARALEARLALEAVAEELREEERIALVASVVAR